jgi:LmbE family N-acetylglucosaminyl deacetylase
MQSIRLSYYLVVTIVLIVLPGTEQISCQQPERWSSSEIYQALEKLNVVGSALYIAAHPDDENTRLISYLSKNRKVRTGYLSLTRGDGGQNLVGPEIRELLGVIRTQELLGARRIDGGEQLFSRANDFGYSKNPDETLKIWDNEQVLSDVVWAIRRFKPDVIINRFDHESAGRTHGHHTSSAMLSYEAFDIVGSGDSFKDQLQYVDPWSPERLFFNTSWWFYGSRENFDKADKSRMLSVDIGGYDPISGISYNETANMARSMHKSQGFGTETSRGSRIEYLQLLKGEMPEDKSDIFSGIDISWDRLTDGQEIGNLIEQVLLAYEFTNPAASVPALLEIRAKIANLENDHWREIKLAEVDDIIAACCGLYLECSTETHSVAPGESVEVEFEAINRSDRDILFHSITLNHELLDTTLGVDLTFNQDLMLNKEIEISEEVPYTNAYWLNEPSELGMYKVIDRQMIGLPETPASIKAEFRMIIDGSPITFKRDLVYKKSDPVKGEVYMPFEVTQPVAVNFGQSVYIFENERPKEIEVLVKCLTNSFNGELRWRLPEGWSASPDIVDLDLNGKGSLKPIKLTITPPSGQQEGSIAAVITDEKGVEYDRSLYEIDYDYIPRQMVFQPAVSKVAKLSLEKAGDKIAYIQGAGDEIPVFLREIGYEVDELDPEMLSQIDYSAYDAVIAGIRAYNTVEALKFANPEILAYVKEGGVYIVQYNTSFRLVTTDIGPFTLEYSRDRVSDELAEIRILEPEHPVLKYPNKITKSDFDNWVQERGLYFPNGWADEYIPILSSNDPGEEPKDGGLLIAQYGDGYFVYTGYSWFRQLPAGVPGAFRLFVNMISLGNGKQP